MLSQLRQRQRKDFKAKVFFVSKTIRSSLDDTDLVVQSLKKTERYFVLGSAIISANFSKGRSLRLNATLMAGEYSRLSLRIPFAVVSHLAGANIPFVCGTAKGEDSRIYYLPRYDKPALQ